MLNDPLKSICPIAKTKSNLELKLAFYTDFIMVYFSQPISAKARNIGVSEPFYLRLRCLDITYYPAYHHYKWFNYSTKGLSQ